MSVLWENAIGYGLHVDRPAPGAPGALYCESDTGNVYRDNGTSWDQIARSGAARSVQTTTVDLVLTTAPVLVIVTADDLLITLPNASDFAGMDVILLGNATTINVALPGDVTADWTFNDASGYQAATFVSDGTAWWQVEELNAYPRRLCLRTATSTSLSPRSWFVVVTAAGQTITLPDIVPGQGLPVTILGTVDAPTVLNPDSTAADGSGQNPWTGMSDGVAWHKIDH